MPCVPSTMMSSSSRTNSREVCSATSAGMPKLRARIAVWEVRPPRSVMNAATWWSLKRITSAGERSRATKIVSSARSRSFSGTAPPWPESAEMIRSATCRTSVRRSRRYSSWTSANCASSSSTRLLSAHSALQHSRSMIERGSTDKVGSSTSMRWTVTKAAMSPDWASNLWAALRSTSSASSSARTALTALSKRLISRVTNSSGIE